MVTSVIPILCETSARWLGRGRSRTNDCAGLTSDMPAVSRQNRNPRTAALNIRKCLLRFKRLDARSRDWYAAEFNAACRIHGSGGCRSRSSLLPRSCPQIGESCSKRHEFGVISDMTSQAEGLHAKRREGRPGPSAFVFRFYVQERVDGALDKRGLSRKMCQRTSGIANVGDDIQLIKLNLEMSPS